MAKDPDGPKRNRMPLPNSPIFAMRGERVKWPTLRKAWLTDESVGRLRNIAHGVIFLDGTYNTNLNYGKRPPEERAVFFEHLQKVDEDHIFLLCWIGNFVNGSIFHCAWQFPQHLNWPLRPLEYAAYRTYRRIAQALYHGSPMDAEVDEFLNRDNSPQNLT